MPLPKNPDAAYAEIHWGRAHEKEYRFDDPALPRGNGRIPAIGALGEVHFVEPYSTGEETGLQFDEGCQLVIGREYPHRLFAALVPSMRTWAQTNLWQAFDVPAWDLPKLAREVGGRQNTLGYVNVRVKPLGELTSVIYLTKKAGDIEEDHAKGQDISVYEHEFGDPNPGIRPWLAVSSDGRLWFVGGDYYVDTHGIID